MSVLREILEQKKGALESVKSKLQIVQDNRARLIEQRDALQAEIDEIQAFLTARGTP